MEYIKISIIEMIEFDQKEDKVPEWFNDARQKYSIEEGLEALNGPTKRPLKAGEKDQSQSSLGKTNIHIAQRQLPFLKKIIRKNKINRLVNNFCIKLKRTGTPRKPTQVEETFKKNKLGILQWLSVTEGWQIPSIVRSAFAIISIMSIVFLIAVYSLGAVFGQESDARSLSQLIKIAQCIALPIMLLQIIINFTSQRNSGGKILVYLNEISEQYVKEKLTSDIVNLVILLIDMSSHEDPVLRNILRISIFWKVPQILQKVQTLEYMYVNNFIAQQYWGLILVFITNFCFAHFLSIILNAMSHLDNQNWLTKYRFVDAPWYERYVWGYYWGTTIMLTVGFGDLAATNYKQAICLTVIEMVSCISLAYNINCVGNLINNLRRQRAERDHNRKTFRTMMQNDTISKQLESKIHNYIEQSFKMKSELNYHAQNAFLEEIPADLKKNYLRQVNIKIFDNIQFLKHLTIGSKYRLAEHIQRKVCHPDEAVIECGGVSKCIILKSGSIGMFYKKNSKECQLIQSLQVKKNEEPKLLNLAFIHRKQLKYFLKSLTYSFIYYFQNEDLESLLRSVSIDHELFCLLRDKHHTTINPQQLYNCKYCSNEQHTMFSCPRLHYIPLPQQVIYKHLNRNRKNQQKRVKVNFRKPRSTNKPLQDKQSMEREHLDFRELVDYMDPVSDHSTIHILKYPTGKEDELSECSALSPRASLELNVEQFKSSTSEKLNIAIAGFLNQREDFWGTQCDVMFNWKYYFPQKNPCNLKKKKFLKIRKQVAHALSQKQI